MVRKGRTGWLVIPSVAIAVCVLAVACGNVGAPDVDRHADSASCSDIAWDPLADATKSRQEYYTLYFQFRSCLKEALPLSVDIGVTRSGGVKMSPAIGPSVFGGNLTGPTVIPDAGTGQTPTSSSTLPALATKSIPGGDGQGGYGSLAGFATIPYWTGQMPANGGPCASSLRIVNPTPPPHPTVQKTLNNCEDDHDSTNQNLPGAYIASVDDFQGQWAVYLPTASLITAIEHNVPFPYLPENFGGNSSGVDSLIATGMIVERVTVGGSDVPLFLTDTTEARGGISKSPAGSKFLTNTSCVDSVFVVNGEETSNKVPTIPLPLWATALTDKNTSLGSWYATINSTPISGENQPVLFLTKGWFNTQGGEFNTIPLGQAPSKNVASTPHVLRVYLASPGDASSGETTCDDGESPQIVGGQIDNLSLTGTSGDTLIANSTISDGDFESVSFYTDQLDSTNLAFTRFLNPDPRDTQFGSAVFTATNFTGTAFQSATGIESAQNSVFYYADLSATDLTQASSVLGNSKFCRTIRPPDGSLDKVDVPHTGLWVDNSDCASPDITMAPRPLADSGCNTDRKLCGYLSIFNNTTRVLTKGLDNCAYGLESVGVRAPETIAPLGTGQVGFLANIAKPPQGERSKMTCGITYTNGPWGKIRVVLSNVKPDGTIGTAITAQVDGGYCAASGNPGDVSLSSACLPKAAAPDLPLASDPKAVTSFGLWPPAALDANNQPIPVKFSITNSQPGDKDPAGNPYVGTFFDLVLCEPGAASKTTGACPTTPALPTYVRALGLPDQPTVKEVLHPDPEVDKFVIRVLRVNNDPNHRLTSYNVSGSDGSSCNIPAADQEPGPVQAGEYAECSLPVVIKNIGTYTFTVVATNAVGTGEQSPSFNYTPKVSATGKPRHKSRIDPKQSRLQQGRH